jgi:hypothetical protein
VGCVFFLKVGGYLTSQSGVSPACAGLTPHSILLHSITLECGGKAMKIAATPLCDLRCRIIKGIITETKEVV